MKSEAEKKQLEFWGLPENAVILPQENFQPKLGGKKNDQEKPIMGLLPPLALNEVANVLTFGAKKYGAHNWRRGLAFTRLTSASLRHIFSWIAGEDTDPESGINHLAHAACNILMLLELQKLRIGEDDRWRPE